MEGSKLAMVPIEVREEVGTIVEGANDPTRYWHGGKGSNFQR